ncbi:MAG: helix-turn-helix domain-containing protein [Firmicutes bacterium]|nr:helix-turn-helix domain-containing protein [Bacillota bacterium]
MQVEISNFLIEFCMTDIGGKIKEARQIKGVSQTQLADILHVRQTSISNWETGVSEPSVDMIRQIAIALECDPNFLFGFD